MTSTRLVTFSCALATLGCGYASTTDHADAAPADGGACAAAITWIDERPIARSRTRFVEPVITGDRDGFLFATTERAPSRCDNPPCVIVERLASSGDGSEVATALLRATSESVALWAETDEGGLGHFAAAPQSLAQELVWGPAPPWTEESERVPLDPRRGVASVAFEAGAVWVVTHAWMNEDTVGEGGEYPIAPRIERSGVDGSARTLEGPDPTEGALFVEAALALSDRGAWLVTNGFYSGPLRAAGPRWSGMLREHAQSGRYAVAADRNSAIVVAQTFGGTLDVARVHEDGRREVAPIDAEPVRWNVAIARGGDRIGVAYATSNGAVRVAILDEALALIASADVPGPAIDDYAVIDLAAASDGTFAVMVAPFPASLDHTAAEPVALWRFRVCG